jgi:6-phosphogluconolactonase (cycloisomerase 2 family)
MTRLSLRRSLVSLGVAMVLAGLAAVASAGPRRGTTVLAPRLLTFVESEYDYTGVYSPTCSAVSPDGEHVYVTSEIGYNLTVFSRDASSGELEFVQVLHNGEGGVTNMHGPYSVVVSPDGDHVYVAAKHQDAVVVFSRNGSTGELTYVENLKDGVGGVDGLNSVHCVTISPDGKHVYTAGVMDDAVALFSRNSSTGQLTFEEVQRDNVGGVDGLDAAYSVAVSPDGKHVYGTGLLDHAVAVFGRNSTTGRLTFVEMVQDGVGGVDGLAGVTSVTVSPDGNHVYTAANAESKLGVFSRNATTGELTFVEIQWGSPGGIHGLGNVQSVAVSPDGNHVCSASPHDDAVVVFSRNATTGKLTFVETQKDGEDNLDGLYRVYSLTFSPDNVHVYTSGYGDGAVVAFHRNVTTGALTFADIKMETSPYLPHVNTLDGARSAAVSPDGSHVYVAAREDDALAAFERDPTSGELDFVQMIDEYTPGEFGLEGANSVAVSPDGNSVYVASVHSDAVAVFSRDVPTGTLTFVEMHQDGVGGVDSLNFASGVAVSPDNNHVYVTAATDDAVTAFARYPATGQLTRRAAYVDGDMGGYVDGLDGAYAVAVSPDGCHVYVVGDQDDAVAVFGRDSGLGTLSFIQVITDTGSVANGLDKARGLAISPDGEYVYVASVGADTLTVYDRNPGSGMLTFVEIHQDGLDGVEGLDGALSVAVSPDGRRVYAAGSMDDSLAVFSRDPESGTLSFEEQILDNTGGVHGLDYPSSIALGPSNAHLYLASYYDDSVAVFRRNLYVYLPLVLRAY